MAEPATAAPPASLTMTDVASCSSASSRHRHLQDAVAGREFRAATRPTSSDVAARRVRHAGGRALLCRARLVAPERRRRVLVPEGSLRAKGQRCCSPGRAAASSSRARSQPSLSCSATTPTWCSARTLWPGDLRRDRRARAHRHQLRRHLAGQVDTARAVRRDGRCRCSPSSSPVVIGAVPTPPSAPPRDGLWASPACHGVRAPDLRRLERGRLSLGRIQGRQAQHGARADARVVVVIALYLSINFAYLHVLGIDALRKSDAVAADLMKIVAGHAARSILSLVVICTR